MNRPHGMALRPFHAWTLACYSAKISPDRIMQTIGNAPASAGTHEKDGTDEFGFDYCAAVDVRVEDLSEAQVLALLNAACDNGFFGWHRRWAGNEHCHLVFAGLKMKASLRAQFHDWAHDRDGLVDHATVSEFVPTEAQINKLRPMFFQYNPVDG